MTALTMSPPEIDILDPELASLNKLLARIPGGKPAPNTIARWRTRGKSGIKLPAIYVRKAWFSTPEAVRWFFSATTANRELEIAAMREKDVTAEDLADVGLQ